MDEPRSICNESSNRSWNNDSPEVTYMSTNFLAQTNTNRLDDDDSSHASSVVHIQNPASPAMDSLAIIRRCLLECDQQAEWQRTQIDHLEESLKETLELKNELQKYKQKCAILEEELKMLKMKTAGQQTSGVERRSMLFNFLSNENQPQESELMSKATVLKLLEIFTCCICNELLIEPGVTNCNHTFCLKCINTWRSTKKECPVCRASIKNVHVVKEIDEFITSVVSSTSDAAYAERLQVIEDRNYSNQPSAKKQRMMTFQEPRPVEDDDASPITPVTHHQHLFSLFSADYMSNLSFDLADLTSFS